MPEVSASLLLGALEAPRRGLEMGYQDRAAAVRQQQKIIWYGYVGAGVMWAGLTVLSRGTSLHSVMMWGTFVGWGVSTVVCLYLSSRAGRQEQRSRRAELRGEEADNPRLLPHEQWSAPLPPDVEERIERDAVVDGYYSRVRADALRDRARRERQEKERGLGRGGVQ